jgi:hypothetical protein
MEQHMNNGTRQSRGPVVHSFIFQTTLQSAQ